MLILRKQSLRPLFPGSNEIDQIDKIHDILGTPEANILEKFKELVFFILKRKKYFKTRFKIVKAVM